MAKDISDEPIEQGRLRRVESINRPAAVERRLEIGSRTAHLAIMQQPIDVDIPHKLGRDEAHRRIANNIHKLKDHIPGGASHLDTNWAGDRLNMTVHAMGQTVEAQIDVEESKVHCRIQLPGMLGLFAAPIEAMLKAKGGDLLLEDKRD